MPFEPLRFVHAANVFLDSPLPHIDEFEQLPEAVRREIERATLTAFSHLVDHCLEQDVDFLLLGGNTFVEADYSLPARIALRNGWSRLAEAGIRLYVLPGDLDPPNAWTRIPERPDGLTILNQRDSEPLAVLRNGKLIAAIAAVDSKSSSDDGDSHGDPPRESGGPFRIGICPLDAEGRPTESQDWMPTRPSAAIATAQTPVRPNTARLSQILEHNRVDYLAVAGVTNRILLRSHSGLIHHPGTTQSLLAESSHAGGCTLVEVDSRDDIRCTSLPTAPVRYQTIKCQPPADETAEEIFAAMCEQIEGIQPQPNERVRVLRWKLEGTSPDLFEAAAALPTETADELSVSLVHVIESPIDDGANYLHSDAAELDALTEEFRRELHEFVAAGGFDPHETISAVDGLSTAAADRLHALISEGASSHWLTRAERTGIQRLQPAAD